MKIFQGYESKPMRKFGFPGLYGLDNYTDRRKPLVVFGCYRKVDVAKIKDHKAAVVLVWGGNDTKKADLDQLRDPKITHVAGVPAMVDFLKAEGLNARRLKMPAMEKPNPTLKGDMVYAYVQKGKPAYHGGDTVKAIADRIDDGVLIGDHSVKRKRWREGVRNFYYGQCFIGLCLSEYAGGAQSVIEMGLRGLFVVTNVLDFPHCLPWQTEDDIVAHIDAHREATSDGAPYPEMADFVYGLLEKDMTCFDTEKSLI